MAAGMIRDTVPGAPVAARVRPMRTGIAALLLAYAVLPACVDNRHDAAPDAGTEEPDAAGDPPPDGRQDLVPVSVRHTTSLVTTHVQYWVHDADGVLLDIRRIVNEPLQVIWVPEGGSLTEVRVFNAVQRRLRTVTDLVAGDVIDFEGRLPLAGEAVVSIENLPAASRAGVASTCGATSIDGNDGSVTVGLAASPCQDNQWLAITTESPRRYQVLTAIVSDGGAVRFSGTWETAGTEDITLNAVPQDGSTTFVRSIVVGRYRIAQDQVQTLGETGTVPATAISGQKLEMVDSVVVVGEGTQRMWSVRDPLGKIRDVALLPELDAPKLDDGLVQWYMPPGGETAQVAVIEMTGPDLDPYHTSWKVITAGSRGTVPVLQPAEGFAVPTGARVTLVETDDVTADEARVAPYAVEDLDWQAAGAATNHASVRTTSRASE
jgi:hypothetical protein